MLAVAVVAFRFLCVSVFCFVLFCFVLAFVRQKKSKNTTVQYSTVSRSWKVASLGDYIEGYCVQVWGSTQLCINPSMVDYLLNIQY
jgi:hypothetical protein